MINAKSCCFVISFLQAILQFGIHHRQGIWADDTSDLARQETKHLDRAIKRRAFTIATDNMLMLDSMIKAYRLKSSKGECLFAHSLSSSEQECVRGGCSSCDETRNARPPGDAGCECNFDVSRSSRRSMLCWNRKILLLNQKMYDQVVVSEKNSFLFYLLPCFHPDQMCPWLVTFQNF